MQGTDGADSVCGECVADGVESDQGCACVGGVCNGGEVDGGDRSPVDGVPGQWGRNVVGSGFGLVGVDAGDGDDAV